MSQLAAVRRMAESFRNGLRYGFVFVRAAWFKMPQSLSVAGKRVALHYPPEHGAQADFFACFVRNDYGLRKQLPPIRTILDIGANVGFFSMAARERYRDATIHAYEPNPRVIEYLRANAAPLGIVLHAQAVGNHAGFVQMIDEGASNQARTSAAQNGGIPLVTLDTAIDRLGGSVDLLKLDCEGAEWDLFELEDAWRRIRNVRMEYHLFRGETVEQVERALQKLGFDAIHWQHDIGFGMVWARRRE
jgi:FkbM family methyltransferase